ncbi:MAG: pilus assembly protein HicB [Prevotellaceae bacterium]|jgi:predicted RNase H-like HicB family nuclease|nr:pilus assembly protein HicB [Prevotellaceae bacterium]
MMKQKVTVIMERASDGGYGCYVDDDLPGFGLSGYGDSAEAAKEDMLVAYDEIKEMLHEEGKDVPELEFIYKYDLQSFFNYFSFLNVSRVAEMAGINASLMRRYTSGVANAGQKQYDKIKKVVTQIGEEMAVATF